MQNHRAGRIEGYAIVSEDGMLANAAGIMPDSLKFDADARFFEAGLNGVDVVVHGRHSEERQPNSPERRRIILTRQIPSIDNHRWNANALLWNPAGASFEQALAALGMPDADIGVIGGPDVFGLFLDRYDVFYLSRAPGVLLPGGRPVFPEVPAVTPEDVLRSGGLSPDPVATLDAANGLTMVRWHKV
jgi:dihydrofolate reductase